MVTVKEAALSYVPVSTETLAAKSSEGRASNVIVLHVPLLSSITIGISFETVRFIY